MKKVAVIFSLLILIPSVLFAASAGSVTATEGDTKPCGPSRTPRKQHTFTMVSDANGDAYDTTATIGLSGTLRLYVVDHDGTVTDGLDIYLYSADTDKDDKDWLYGSCDGLSSTNSSTTNSGVPLNIQGGRIDLPPGDYYTSGKGFGASKTVYFYLTEE